MGFALLAALFCTMLSAAVPGLWVMLIAWCWWGLFWKGYLRYRADNVGRIRAKAEILLMAAAVVSLQILTNPRMIQLFLVPVALVLWVWCLKLWNASRRSPPAFR